MTKKKKYWGKYVILSLYYNYKNDKCFLNFQTKLHCETKMTIFSSKNVNTKYKIFPNILSAILASKICIDFDHTSWITHIPLELCFVVAFFFSLTNVLIQKNTAINLCSWLSTGRNTMKFIVVAWNKKE